MQALKVPAMEATLPSIQGRWSLQQETAQTQAGMNVVVLFSCSPATLEVAQPLLPRGPESHAKRGRSFVKASLAMSQARHFGNRMELSVKLTDDQVRTAVFPALTQALRVWPGPGSAFGMFPRSSLIWTVDRRSCRGPAPPARAFEGPLYILVYQALPLSIGGSTK